MKIFLTVGMAMCFCLPVFSLQASDKLSVDELSPLFEEAKLIDDGYKAETFQKCQECMWLEDEGQKQTCIKNCVVGRCKDIFGASDVHAFSPSEEIRNTITQIERELAAQAAVSKDYKSFTDGILNSIDPIYRNEFEKEIKLRMLGVVANCQGYRDTSRDINYPPSRCIDEQLSSVKLRLKEESEKLSEDSSVISEMEEDMQKQQKRFDDESNRIKNMDKDIENAWNGNEDEAAAFAGVNINHNPKQNATAVKKKGSYVPQKYKTVKSAPPPPMGENRVNLPDGEYHHSATVTPNNRQELSAKAKDLVIEARDLISLQTRSMKVVLKEKALNMCITRCQSGDIMCEACLQNVIGTLR
ncbi:MAG: hypothetical protein L6420_02265 [Elusimicrobia bacterium]|nr:hypothetical protein [Elusimicrobiota bacterium]